jgi:hypothetical protein
MREAACMPTVFLHSHNDLVNLAIACRGAAAKHREYSAAASSFSVKETHEEVARMYERMAATFSAAAKQQEVMWKIHRKG